MVALALLAGLGLFLLQARVSILSPVERDYGEGIVLWQAAHISNLGEAFHPVAQYPHIVFHYAPLFHYSSRLVNLVVPDLLMAGRLVSAVSALGIAALASWMVFFAAGPGGLARALATLVTGLMALHLPATFWSLLMRVDTLGILISFAGVFLYLRSGRQPRLAYAACVCFVLAVYTKQTLIAAPAACLACEMTISPRRALRMAGFEVLLGALIGAAFSLATHGQFFAHLFGHNLNPIDLRQGLWLFRADLEHAALPIAFGMAEMLMILAPVLTGTSPLRWRDRLVERLTAGGRSRLGAVASLYMVLALGVSSTAAKQGADANYFLEWNLVCCLLSGLFLVEALEPWERGEPWSAATAAGVAALALIAFNSTQAIEDPTRYRESEPYKSAYQEIAKRVAAFPGPVYSDVMTPLWRAGKEIPAEPAIVTILAENGRWDERPFVERFRRREFNAVVVSTSLDKKEFYTPALREAIRTNYEMTFEKGPFQIYTPRRIQP